MKNKNGHSVGKFTLLEKLFAYSTFNLGIFIGAYGLSINNKVFAIMYLVYSYVGILLLMRYTVCPRCPHLHRDKDCINLPASLTKKIISSTRKGPLTISEKILFCFVLYGILIIPIHWIASYTYILIAFIVLYGGYLLGLNLHFCPECDNRCCIQNRNKKFKEI